MKTLLMTLGFIIVGLSPMSIKAAIPQAPEDAASAIQSLLDQDKDAVLLAGTYLVSRTIELPSGGRIQGAGKGRTVLKLKSGVNDDLIRTAKFESLKGKPLLSTAPSDFSIMALSLDGNYMEKRWNADDNRINNDRGSCLKVYGKRFQIDIEINNCAEHGLYVEGQGPRRGEEIASTIRVTGQAFGKEAMIFRGPGDILIEYAVLGLAGILPRPMQLTQIPLSLLYPEYQKVDGVVIEKVPPYEGTVEIGFMHTYAAWSGAGLRSRGNPRLQARHLISESNLGGIAISPGTWGGIGLLDIHSNGKTVPGMQKQVPTPMEGALIESLGPFNIAAGVVNRTVGSGEDWTAVRITGQGQIINLSLRGNVNPQTKELYRGDGVVVEGSGNLVNVAASRSNGSTIKVNGPTNQVSGAVTNSRGACSVTGKNNSVSITSDSSSCSLLLLPLH